MDNSELIERYAILLLGSKEGVLPSIWHLQKEMFLLSNFRKDLKEDLNFEKHYSGPYSQVLDESIKNPLFFSDAFDFEDRKIFLSISGKKEFQKMFFQN